jgi:hypothetical protein
MTLKVRCQQCGKTSQYSASDAGLTALCVACGARFTVPTEPAEQLNPQDIFPDDPAQLAAAPPPDAAQRLADSLRPAASPPPPPAPSSRYPIVPASDREAYLAQASTLAPGGGGSAGIAETGSDAARAPRYTPPPEPAGSRFKFPLPFVVLGAALAFVIVLTAVLIVSVKPSWEQKNAAAVRNLKSRAEAFAVERKYRQAYDTYGEMDRLVGGHTIEDPALRADVERARAARDALVKAMVARGQQVEERTMQSADQTEPPTPAVADAQPAPSTSPPPEVAPARSVPPIAGGFSIDDLLNWPEYQPRSLTTRPTAATVASPATAPSEKPVVMANAIQRPPPTTVESRPSEKTANTTAAASRPAIVVRRGLPDGRPDGGVTDEQIGRSIQRGVDHLLARFVDGRLLGGPMRNDSYYTGLNALCVYALLQSSMAIKDERLNLKGPLVRSMVDKMKAMTADDGPATYARGIRATALALLNRSEDRSALGADVKYLLDSHHNGAYWYNARWKSMGSGESAAVFRGGRWDNSNSQYGLLGVWSAAEVGAEINQNYWTAVEQHWTDTQGADGAWDYTNLHGAQGGRISMTLAGVASLFVTHDYLDAPRMGAQVGRDPFSKPLARGLAYLESGDTAVNVNGGYSLYGLERVGLASGFKYFGDHDWYRELAGLVVRSQEADGSWGGEVETAYHLLFLARGRHPILMNKLRFDGYWANRPRDVANLARFGSRELERQLNWQVVPITRAWNDWTDSPILYIATHTPPALAEADLAKIRAFVQSGGLLFTQSDGNQPAVDRWVEELAKKLFPLYELKDLPDNHEVFSILYKPSPRPRLRGVSNGARLLMVHSPTDVSQHWQMRAEKTRRSAFELGMNLFLYASGKADLRNRLASSYLPAPEFPAAGGRVAITRVKYPGNWDPEPMAWQRFSRYFQRETDVALDLTSVEFDKLSARAAGTFAHWTGTDAYTPTFDQITALRNFVQAGGVVLVEPCGGSGEFYDSVRAALAKAFPESPARLLPRTHPILTASGPGMDELATPQLRPYVKAKGIGTSGRLEIVSFGQGHVILNPLDLTEGLLAANTWGISGFEPNYAQQLAKNLVLWSATGMKGE